MPRTAGDPPRDPAPGWPGRVLLGRVLAWFCALVAAVPMFGLIDLGTVFGLSDPQYTWQVGVEASWGALFTFVIAAGFAQAGWTPTRAAQGVALPGLAAGSLAVAAAVFRDPAPLVVAGALLVATVAVAWILAARPQPRTRPSLSAALVVSAAGVPLWLGYAALTHAAWLRDPTVGDVTNGVDHWPVQAALGLTLALGSAALALRPGVRWWRWCFALSAGVLAYATLAFPDRAGAMPHPAWGWLFAVWALLILLPPCPSAARIPAR
ncbi:hypothetical protein G7070_06960 [Propioniciclava coleopterorum]|uniref:Uncharacterized protein n=1 Tax=Propioniciclava coleopterorum TaxID=2714937 RepID=A0A6G7Y591_9ACTN|nr:hypothetical protein [Propioniciclava coleopterorum]QIK72054.1 hypothetical protein G7070_06960 [Propioniciclava coleopterorum]